MLNAPLDPCLDEVLSPQKLPSKGDVPSCVLVGKKLDDFALKDVNGQTWKYRRYQTAVWCCFNFWYSTCSPCKHAIPHLNELQKKYSPSKLEVIGIACESGTVAEQVHNVISVRGRYGMSYRTLLSGGGPDHCPVVNQFGIAHYPTLVLLDETVRIVCAATSEGWTITLGKRWKSSSTKYSLPDRLDPHSMTLPVVSDGEAERLWRGRGNRERESISPQRRP